MAAQVQFSDVTLGYDRHPAVHHLSGEVAESALLAVVGFSIGAVALKAGGGSPQVLAYVIAWALFAFQRLLLWEIPFMPARFVWFRAAVSIPFPFLAAAIAMVLGRP